MVGRSFREYVNDLLRSLFRENVRLREEVKSFEEIRLVCDKYNIKLEDLPAVLEEYIAYDNDDNW